MNYDFTTVINRRHTDSVKWNVKDSELPMSIADMDFKTAPEIVLAMREKLELGAFGYEEAGVDYFNAVSHWYQLEHGADADTGWMIFATGVVPPISSIVRRVYHIGDNVLVQEPVYNIFYNSIENNGRHVLSNDLIYSNGKYEINWQDLEESLANPLTTLMIFCNPHNPTGIIWKKSEVERIASLCQENNVILLSDEIHGDLVRNNVKYAPAFSVAKTLRSNVISLVSPSKTFNVAALHAATVIIPDNNLRDIINRGLNSDELAEPNLLAIPATIAAYTEGFNWLHELLAVIDNNFAYVEKKITSQLENVKIVSGPATYLMWLDVSKITHDSYRLAVYLRKETGLIMSTGSIYRGNGNEFLRINLASPKSMVEDGISRLITGIKKYSKK
ncbi:MalY/PatB family protein [Lactobacillus taiwanensis]|uniref:MalY/PatB family protein n=1 Tax=Lactobacillus taiwanensis TaxID=508451 RepID=UPI00241EBE7B|nr:aminotransferase class I/II-fold pyridoxal phosphate-dependent enzyme [Lactobacillus taiwanensis]